ncbi:Sugar phosphate isomerase/epimerase [Paenibacillus sp. 1_12]|uniref:sugar phosphate isomerase/epimerase family protein n=1 Tax=Paenibacillus sp. 1_12 TaxID=1566278 RepID=UPI0008E2423B|nr:sugar phosphate isomerase/epimerase family protein [Paenibacillus sp. 1_12]SFL24537.1 Sugar phosphate isomerase/epimerase [Paenibacillus sp. 1_12]
MNAFGWCMQIEHAEELQRYGYDYIECMIAPLLSLDNEAFKKALPLYVNSPLPVKAWNVLFPGDIKVVGPEANETIITNYLARAVDTMSQAGSSVFVFGSGKSRSIPDGWEQARAEEQLLRLLRIIAEQVKGTNLTLAIEPLNTKESNVITSVAEGVYYAKQINDPAIRVLADFYHMDEESEPLETLFAHKEWLSHIHIADTGRLAPGTGQYPYESFVAQLKAAGYNGMVSAECTLKDADQELPASLKFMKEQWSI